MFLTEVELVWIAPDFIILLFTDFIGLELVNFETAIEGLVDGLDPYIFF